MKKCWVCGSEIAIGTGDYFSEYDGGHWMCDTCADDYKSEKEKEEREEQKMEAEKLGLGLFGVKETDFHGGGVIAENLTALEAIETRDECVGDTDCVCGCAEVFEMDEKNGDC